MTRKLTVTLMSLALILIPSLAFAVDMEFYTYGGFDAVVNAFVQLVMIFGDSSYQTLYYTAVVCGIAGGATVAVVKLIAGMQSNILGWAPIAALGMAIYVGLFVPKGNLTIYDPVYNRFQTVPNVPNGVVIIAGTMNAIERGLVDIVSNSSSPDAFQTQAGGKGFLGLFNLTTTPLTAVDTNLDSSMTRYIDDCVGFALNNSSSGLTVNELRKNTTSFSTSLAKAANPANFTVFYNAANPNGQTMSCQAAWSAITTAMTPAALQGNTNAQCSMLGFNVASAAERIQCQTMMYNSQNVSALGAASLDAFVQQSYIAQKLDYVFRSGDGAAATNYQFMMNASGSMKAANDWLPVLRAVLTAIAVALIPFLCIFLPTPICGRVLGMMFGLFVWLTTWGVTDAIMHQFAMNHAYKLMELVRQNQLGMDAFLFFPTQAAKTLSMFGTMRMGGLVLATALSGMLVKFGGHAMAMLAGNITGQIQGAGVKGESQTADPTGRAQSITSNTSAMPTQAWANGHSWNARTGEAWAKIDSGTASFENMSAELGGAGGVSRMMANANTARTVDFGSKGAAMMKAGLANSANTMEFNHAANLEQLFTNQTAFHNDPKQLGGARAGAEAALASVADRIGWKASDLSLATHQFAIAGGFSQMQSAMALTGATDATAAGGEVGRGQGFAAVANTARADQIRAAANLAAPESWKNNPDLWNMSNNALTPLGVGRFIAGMQGVGIAFSTPYGHTTMDVTEGGKLAQATATGIMPGSDKAGMDKLANTLERAGLNDSAAAVRSYSAGGKSFNFAVGYDKDRNIGTADTAHGGTSRDSDFWQQTSGHRSDHFDYTTSTTGRNNQHFDLTSVQTGFRGESGSKVQSYDVNEGVISHGVVLNPQTAMQMALGGNSRFGKLIGAVTNASGSAKDGTRWNVASGIASGMSNIKELKGRDMNIAAAEAAAGAGLDIKIFSATLKGSVSTQSQKMTTVDLATHGYNAAMKTAEKQGRDQGLSGSQLTNYVTEKTSEFTKGFIEGVEKPHRYGAKTILGPAPDPDAKHGPFLNDPPPQHKTTYFGARPDGSIPTHSRPAVPKSVPTGSPANVRR